MCGAYRTALILASAVLAGCEGEAGVEATGPVVTDSAGITIIDNGALDLDRNLLASSTPALEIGVLDGGEEYQLFRVTDAKRLSDGAIAVANGGSRDVRIYEPDGTHRVTVGGGGEGPSEFGFPGGLRVLPGDTIEVLDRVDRVYFAPDGTFLRRETTSRQELMGLLMSPDGFAEGGEWLADGRLFTRIHERIARSGPPEPGPLRRPRMTMVRLSADLSTVDTLGEYGGILQQFLDVGGERGVRAIVPPYAVAATWASGTPDGTIVVGDAARPAIDRFHPDGSRSIIRWTDEPEPITAADVEAWKERQRNSFWTEGQLPELERAWAAMDIPETKAFYGRVDAGSDGTVWIGAVDATSEPTRLLRFDAAGRYTGTVEIPGQFTPRDSGPGWVLGVVRGEADVEYVHLYELTTQG